MYPLSIDYANITLYLFFLFFFVLVIVETLPYFSYGKSMFFFVTSCLLKIYILRQQSEIYIFLRALTALVKNPRQKIRRTGAGMAFKLYIDPFFGYPSIQRLLSFCFLHPRSIDYAEIIMYHSFFPLQLLRYCPKTLFSLGESNFSAATS